MTLYVEGSSMLKQRTGVGQYTKRLIEAYVDEYPDEKVRVFGFKFFTQGDPEYPIKLTKNFKYNINRWLPGRVYNQLYKYSLAPPIDILQAAKPKDTFFYPNFITFPSLYNRRSMVIVHDLSFVHYSQYAHPKDLPFKLKYTPKSVARAAMVVTISENSKREIIEHYKVPARKIAIIHPGVDADFFKPASQNKIQVVKSKYNLPKKYILYAGTIEPRKNIDGLLKAYDALPKKLRDNYGLVLAGGKGWKDDGIVERITALQAKGLKIVLTGYLPDDDLPSIHTGASLFVFPSYYEGFGMPPLEAMACGTPVVSADNSSLPEAVGKAGLLVQATNPNSLSSAIERGLTDEALRKKLIAAGHAQVKKFSWGNSAQELKAALDQLDKLTK